MLYFFLVIFFTHSLCTPVVWNQNQHFYELVSFDKNDVFSANNSASVATFTSDVGQFYNGYLATITSYAEMLFVINGLQLPSSTYYWISLETNNINQAIIISGPENGFILWDSTFLSGEQCRVTDCPIPNNPSLSSSYGWLINVNSKLLFNIYGSYNQYYYIVEYNSIQWFSATGRFFQLQSQVPFTQIPSYSQSTWSTDYWSATSRFVSKGTLTTDEWTYIRSYVAVGINLWTGGYKDVQNNWRWMDTDVIFYSNTSVCLIPTCPWRTGNVATAGSGNYVIENSNGMWAVYNSAATFPFVVTYDCPLNCMNGGSYSGACYSCSCFGSWTGLSCDFCSLRCSNGATPNPVCSNCNCIGNWRGTTCTSCSLQCSNGGSPNQNCTQCNCIYNWIGSSCQTCSLQCFNGGSPNLQCSTCNCVGLWSGTSCQTCSLQCSNGGTPNQNCNCNCIGYWSDSTCQTCSLQCYNGGTYDQNCTQCNCIDNWVGTTCQTCPLQCYNGGSPNQLCTTCNCVGYWSGSSCQYCNLPCSNGGTPFQGCTKCNCVNNWGGTSCQTCSLQCSNGGYPNQLCTACDCVGNWEGSSCQTCSLLCNNGGTQNIDCTCNCLSPWGGPTCNQLISVTTPTPLLPSPPPSSPSSHSSPSSPSPLYHLRNNAQTKYPGFFFILLLFASMLFIW